MNTKSEDVVKNVELNQVESTSNEQRQTVKPIVISRRRLLRAGVAGIPVVLTMAGLAPGIENINAASAASGLNYDGLGTVNRISGTVNPDNGLIWSDQDGFVLNSQSGPYYTASNGLKSTSGTYTSSKSGSFEFKYTDDDETDTKTVTTITLSLNVAENSITGNPRLHKLGNYYIALDDNFQIDLSGTDVLTGSGDSYTLTIQRDDSAPVIDLGNWNDAEDANGKKWYCLTDGTASNNSTVKSIKIKVTNLSFTDNGKTYVYSPNDSMEFEFSNISVQLPTKLE